MSTPLVVGLTLLGGGAGAVLRAMAVSRAPRLGTAAVNVVGTALLALVLVAVGRGLITTGVAVILGVGVSGSLTTFSGWMAVLADGFAQRPWRTLVLDLLLPLLLAVALMIVVLAALA